MKTYVPVVSCVLTALLIPGLPLYNIPVQPQQPRYVRPSIYSPGYELLLLLAQHSSAGLANVPSITGSHEGTGLSQRQVIAWAKASRHLRPTSTD